MSKTMTTNALAQLETDGKTAKRAQYEAFEFSLEAPGLLRVTNGSYGDDAEEHSYLVNVEDGVPTACECKSFEYRDGACKHMVAVAIREPVLSAADGEPAVATDGGQVVAGETDRFGNELEHYDDPTYGAGERGECQQCGREHTIALVAATAVIGEKWEEHYACDCGAKGRFVNHNALDHDWEGQIQYPGEGGR